MMHSQHFDERLTRETIKEPKRYTFQGFEDTRSLISKYSINALINIRGLNANISQSLKFIAFYFQLP